MKQSTRLLISAGLALVVSLTIGMVLATRTTADMSGCSLVRGRCDPRMTLPYFWPGSTLLVAGSFVGLVLLAFGVRQWAQLRASRS
jgi:hypothetical protein